MACIRGGHIDPLASREARPKSSAPQDSSQALTVPSSKSEVSSSPPQRQYATRRPPNSPPLEPLVHRIPPKRARTSSPEEMSRHAQPDPQAPMDSQRPFGIAPEAIIKRPMVIVLPIEGNSYCRAMSFHFKLYFDIEAMQQQPKLRDSFGLLQRYHLKRFMTHRGSFYPRVLPPFISTLTGVRVF